MNSKLAKERENISNDFYDKRMLHEQMRQFTLFLYENPLIPRSQVESVIHSFDNFLTEKFVPHMQKQFKRKLDDFVNSEAQGRIHSLFEQNKNPFRDFASEHKRFKIYKNDSFFFEPEEFIIANNKLLGDTAYGVHISLVATLKHFLELPGVYKSINNYLESLKSQKDIISNVTQGKLWKTKYCEDGRNLLPFFLFFDDIETGNGMGSHAGEQKLGMVYGSLPCLPPHLVAKLTNIFLTTIFYSDYRSQYGNDSVFQKVMEDLKELSENGLKICVDGVIETVYLDCLLILGDNLGLNGCCGFVDGFNAHYYCRICRANSKQCQELCTEDVTLLRNRENYSIDLKNKDKGVKNECIFNKLPNFHIVENRTVDLMHDLFEGVGRDVLEKILTNFIRKKKLFSLEELNRRIESFEYGDIEKSNKPRTLTTTSCKPCEAEILKCKTKVKVKQSAAEMACLIRYLGLIMDDLIPPNSKEWELYIALREIVGIVTAPRYVMADLSKLRKLIEKHHSLYKTVFGPLKPKFHMMTHLPLVMYENGPAIHYWAMTFERKHHTYKEVVTGTSSSRNLPLTIAIRNQLLLSCRKERLQNIDFDYELGSIDDENAGLSYQIRNSFDNVTNGVSYKLIEIAGHKFCNGTIFVKGVEEDEYGGGVIFAKLKKILKINDQIYLQACTLSVESFDRKYYAHRVQDSDYPDALIHIDSVCRVPPCVFYKNLQSKFLVATRYDV